MSIEKNLLICEKCEYPYDGTFSGRINSNDIFLHEGFLWIIIFCEGCCGFRKIIKLKIEDTISTEERNPFNYILENKWKNKE